MKIILELLWKSLFSFHCELLEYWNTQKSIWRIWQQFSCLLDKGIPKIWKKLNSHNGFLSYLQNSTANSAHLAAHSISSIFLESPHQVDMKIVVKSSQNFFGYFNTLETHSGTVIQIFLPDMRERNWGWFVSEWWQNGSPFFAVFKSAFLKTMECFSKPTSKVLFERSYTVSF